MSKLDESTSFELALSGVYLFKSKAGSANLLAIKLEAAGPEAPDPRIIGAANIEERAAPLTLEAAGRADPYIPEVAPTRRGIRKIFLRVFPSLLQFGKRLGRAGGRLATLSFTGLYTGALVEKVSVVVEYEPVVVEYDGVVEDN